MLSVRALRSCSRLSHPDMYVSAPFDRPWTYSKRRVFGAAHGGCFEYTAGDEAHWKRLASGVLLAMLMFSLRGWGRFRRCLAAARTRRTLLVTSALIGVNWSGARATGYDVEPADVRGWLAALREQQG